MEDINILNKDNLILYFPFNTNLSDRITGIKCHHYSENDTNEQVQIVNAKYLNDNKFDTALYFNGNYTKIEIYLPRKYNERLMKPSLFAIDFYYYIDKFIDYSGIFRFRLVEDSHLIYTNQYMDTYSCWMEKYRSYENLFFGTKTNNIPIKLEKNKWNHFLFIYNESSDSKFLLYHNEKLISNQYIPEYPFGDSYIQDISFGMGLIDIKNLKKYKNAIFYLKNLKIYYKPERNLKEKIKDSLPIFFPKRIKYKYFFNGGIL